MKSSSRIAVFVAAAILCRAAAYAGGVDFKDPRRALGREDDIRVDAEMLQETLSPGAPISITFQIENLTASPIAIADKVTAASFDPDSDTITMSIGAEIPQGAAMPHLTTIAPGQTRTFRTGATPQVLVANAHSPWAHAPRLVQITVNMLHDIAPFAALIAKQNASTAAPQLPNDLFDKWVASVSSVALNTLPIRWSEERSGMSADASAPARRGRY
jgi:hypothetical protein